MVKDPWPNPLFFAVYWQNWDTYTLEKTATLLLLTEWYY
jgi:hypothetical protein